MLSVVQRVSGFLIMVVLSGVAVYLMLNGYVPLLVGTMFLLLFIGCGVFYIKASRME